MTWHEAIKKVLSETSEALHYTEIAERIRKQELRESVGANPAITVSSYISTSINNEGDGSPYKRVGLGTYMLREGYVPKDEDIKVVMTWHVAIQTVLSESPEALHYTEIAERIRKQELRESVGATPARTVAAYISTSINNEGDNSPYKRVGLGTYMLREDYVPENDEGDDVSENIEGDALNDNEQEEQYDIITSFGMFWRTKDVLWKNTPEILGNQGESSISVNFCEQVGIYLLYDGREVIYVGKAEDSIGKRLYEHTKDRLSGRWDRFSWFGLKPVSHEGKLGELPESFSGKKIITVLEAVLIEAVEPRQNRKRGDDLKAVEYIQLPNPEIAENRANAISMLVRQ